jgi:hypothetical protein
VVPLLFAVALLAIKQPEMAGSAVLGTFAHLVLVASFNQFERIS